MTPAGVQLGESAGVAAVGLHPITGPLRHQPGRHHLADDPAPDEITVETEAGRTGLVATAHLAETPQRTLEGLEVVGQRPLVEQLIPADSRKLD